MLTGLRLKNIALIDFLDLEFKDGFTVLTGETGAGKSILLDALDALLGGLQGPAGYRMLANKAERGFVEATFEPSAFTQKWLRDHEIDLEDFFDITREWIRKNDRIISRFRINGISISRSQILELRPLLIDLSLQGQTSQLSSSQEQRILLDNFGKMELTEAIEESKKAWYEWKKALEIYEIIFRQFAENQDLLGERKRILHDLLTANINEKNEIENLETEQERLSCSVRLFEGLGLLNGCLSEGIDEAPSVLAHFSTCINEFNILISKDKSLTEMKSRFLEIEACLNDLINDLRHYEKDLNSEPDRLDHVQERLLCLKRLENRYNMKLPELISFRNELDNSINTNNIEIRLSESKKKLSIAKENLDLLNKSLTQKRIVVARELEKNCTTYLSSLGLKNVIFKIDISPCEPNEFGADSIKFLCSTNLGVGLAPLGEVASGGEMSRFYLAIKAALAKVHDGRTLIFDEIDSGVSGRVSKAVARALKELSCDRQVFCITHQPLVAVAADQHYRVSKSINGGVTRSQVTCLHTKKERLQELAELAGGGSEQASIYAASLLEQQAA